MIRMATMLLCLALPAMAQQRSSEGLVDCAAITALPALVGPGGAEGEDGRRAVLLSAAFRDAALQEASAEGRVDAETFVGRMLEAKRSAWADRGPNILAAQEYRDRIGVCRAIGRSRGVPGLD